MRSNSPTSVNTYLQCPRLYYHRFVSPKGIFVKDMAILKGEIMHKALQDFFDAEPDWHEADIRQWCSARIRKVVRDAWSKRENEIESLGLLPHEIKNHRKDCEDMATHWAEQIANELRTGSATVSDAFYELKPQTEVLLTEPILNIKGYVDAIRTNKGNVTIIDYKTSTKVEVTREQKLQLGIYAWLYWKVNGVLPTHVGIHFLRERLHLIPVDRHTVKYAETQIKKVNKSTQSDDIKDYPQGTGYLCSALRGKCPCRQYDQLEEI